MRAPALALALRALALAALVALSIASCTVIKVECRVDADCNGANEVCEDNSCIECERDADCDDDEECNDGDCEPIGGEGGAEGEGGEGGEGDEGEGEEGEGEVVEPFRRACTGNFGTALIEGSGRIDGVLVSVVMPDRNGCRGDDNHVHLQVETDGAVYDVVINVASEFAEEDPRVALASFDLPAPPGPPWSEGWHSFEVVDYAFDLGISSSTFTPFEIDALADEIDALTAEAGTISVYMHAFNDGTGGHKVHRNSSGTDGLIVVNPTGGSPTGIAFKFSDQLF